MIYLPYLTVNNKQVVEKYSQVKQGDENKFQTKVLPTSQMVSDSKGSEKMNPLEALADWLNSQNMAKNCFLWEKKRGEEKIWF